MPDGGRGIQRKISHNDHDMTSIGEENIYIEQKLDTDHAILRERWIILNSSSLLLVKYADRSRVLVRIRVLRYDRAATADRR